MQENIDKTNTEEIEEKGNNTDRKQEWQTDRRVDENERNGQSEDEKSADQTIIRQAAENRTRRASIREKVDASIPEWIAEKAYALFYGALAVIKRVFHTLAFGRPEAAGDLGRSFQRTMDAERYKAEKKGVDKEAKEEAKEHGKEAQEDARNAQKRNEREDKHPEKKDSGQKTDDPVKDETKKALSVEEKIKKTAYRLSGDLKEQGYEDILRLVRDGKDGKEKECFVSREKLESLDPKMAKEYIYNAASYAGAQRFLDHKGLRLAGVGERQFILERPGGASFSFRIEMLSSKNAQAGTLKDAAKEFLSLEKEYPGHVANLTEDMERPLTPATIGQPELGNMQMEIPKEVKLDIDIPDPYIRMTTKEALEKQPYPGLYTAGFDTEIDKENGVVKVTDIKTPENRSYLFRLDDSRLQDGGNMQKLFSALETMGAKAEIPVPEVPSDFSHRFNEVSHNIFQDYGLFAFANSTNDKIYIFPASRDHVFESSPCWDISMSALYQGDATELKRVLYEFQNKREIKEAERNFFKDYPSDLKAAMDAAGIVSYIKLDYDKASHNENIPEQTTIAVSQVELPGEAGRLEASRTISEEGSGLLFSINGKEQLLDTDDLDAFRVSLSVAAEELSAGAVMAPHGFKLSSVMPRETEYNEQIGVVNFLDIYVTGELPEPTLDSMDDILFQEGFDMAESIEDGNTSSVAPDEIFTETSPDFPPEMGLDPSQYMYDEYEQEF